MKIVEVIPSLETKPASTRRTYTCSMADFHHQMEAFKQQWRSRFQ